MSNGKNIFKESTLLCFFKNKHIFEKSCTIACSEITFSTNSFYIETSKLIALQINWLISIRYDFLLKGVPEQNLITAIVTDFRIIIVLHDLNSRNQGYQLRV